MDKITLKKEHAKIMRQARKTNNNQERTMLYYKAYCIDAQLQGEYPVPFRIYEKGI
jgi:hypothetical protein